MEQDEQENRKERLESLLKKNKVRLARENIIKTFKHDLQYELTKDQFIDLEIANNLLRLTYKKIPQVESSKFIRYEEVLSEILRLKKCIQIDSSALAVFYYLDKLKAGGMKIPLKDCWELIERIGNTPRSDIVVVEEHAVFGLCVELDEHSYSVAYWGLI